jgi:hypothetical protein
LVLLAMLIPTTTAMAIATHRAGETWCGISSTKDWACGRHGLSWAGSHRLSIRSPRLLPGSSVISTAEGGSARVTLGAEAQCTVGTGAAASKAVTRPTNGVLLQQESGGTSCGTPRRSGIKLCTKVGCNVQLETEGVMLADVLSEEATVSDYLHEEVFHHRVRIVACSGFISVSSPAGSASGGAAGSNRYVIEIDEYTYARQSETTTETSHEGTIEVTATAEATAGAGAKIVESAELPGRGPCKAKFVREEERKLKRA